MAKKTGTGRNDHDIERANAIKEYMQQALTFDLNEQEAIQYISGRLGKRYKKGKNKDKTIKIGRSTYYEYKRLVKENMGDVDKRMFEHAKVGFIIKHFEVMDTITESYKHLRGAMFVTTSPIQKAALAQQVKEFAYLLWQLNISSPVIDQMKQYVTEQLKSNPTPTKEEEKIADDTGAQSALVLPKGFFGSGLDSEDDSGGISAGKEPVDRVFEKPRKSKGQAVLDQR